MTRYRTIAFFVLSLHVLAAQTHVAKAITGLNIFYPPTTPFVRVTGFPDAVYGLTVAPDATIYWDTGTASGGYNGRIMSVSTNGTVNNLVPAVNAVIGVNSNLQIGFGGNLYSPTGVLFPAGIQQYTIPGGASSEFFQDPAGGPDSNIVFDSAHQVMYMSEGNNSNVVAVDVSAHSSIAATTPTFTNGHLALEPNGTLIDLSSQGLMDVLDPLAHTATPLADFSSIIANVTRYSSVAVDPQTGDIYFNVWLSNSATEVYRVHQNGSGLGPVVSTDTYSPGYVGGIANISIGPSGDGSGRESLYLGINGNPTDVDGKIIELRSIPEPSSVVLCGLGAVLLLGAWSIRRRAEIKC